MELEKLFGLPAHPLLVHLPVVLLPLAGIIAVVFAVKPNLFDKYGWHLVVLTGLGAFGGILAAGSGEGLADIQNKIETAAREEHFEFGETARTMGLLFFLVVLAVVVVRYLAKRRAADSGLWGFAKSKNGAILMSVVLVLSAAGSTWAISKAGHQGAKLVWGDQQYNGGGDHGGDDGDD